MAMNNPYATKYLNLATTPQKGSAEYSQVEKDAQKEYLDRLKAIDDRIKQVQALRQADVAGIRRNQNIAQRDINDQMFREYLANRERMGGRGISNSGLMADAQIRLNANKQDRMAELYNQMQDKLSEVNRTYAPQQTELLGERQNTRQSKIFQEMFDKYRENQAREAQLLSPLMQNEFSVAEAQRNRAFQAGQTSQQLAAQREAAKLSRQFELDKELRTNQREDRFTMAKQYQDELSSLQQNKQQFIDKLSEYETIDKNALTDEQKNNMKILEKQIQNASNMEKYIRNVATAYLSGDPKKINDAMYLYNFHIQKIDPHGNEIATPVVSKPVVTDTTNVPYTNKKYYADPNYNLPYPPLGF